MDIEAMFDLRVNPRPPDLINEPNLKTYGLASVDGDDETSRAYAVVAPTEAISTSPTAQGGISRLTLTVVAPSSLALLAHRGEIPEPPMPISRAATSTPAKATPVSRGSSLCIYDLFSLIFIPSFHLL